jgi:hypothetical protein
VHPSHSNCCLDLAHFTIAVTDLVRAKCILRLLVVLSNITLVRLSCILIDLKSMLQLVVQLGHVMVGDGNIRIVIVQTLPLNVKGLLKVLQRSEIMLQHLQLCHVPHHGGSIAMVRNQDNFKYLEGFTKCFFGFDKFLPFHVILPHVQPGDGHFHMLMTQAYSVKSQGFRIHVHGLVRVSLLKLKHLAHVI